MVTAPAFCSVCRRDDVELRPYGHGRKPICVKCMRSTPERQREGMKWMRKAMAAAGDMPVIIPGEGPISIEEAGRRGILGDAVFVDTRSGLPLPRAKS